MHRTPLITARRVSPFEGFAWYWLWSGTLCLWLVPAAREVSHWLVGVPLALLVGHFVLSWAQRGRTALPLRSPPVSLMTPADVAAVAQRLRSTGTLAPVPTARARTRRRGRLAAVALLSR
jgi:hypothetical protein